MRILLFRFASTYLVLYGVTLALDGRGDTAPAYVRLLVCLASAIAIALSWTLLDRKRRNDVRLYEWLRVGVRFALSLAMIAQGAAKVFPTPLLALTTDRLMQPYGDSSPLGLLGTFLGGSALYSLFTGLSELAGGLLLTLRRTTLLGALVCIGVLSNTVMLNFAYDGAAKLFSTHLLLMAVFLAAPGLQRLANVFLLNRTAEPEEVHPLFRSPRLSRSATVVAAVFVLSVTGAMLYGSYKRSKEVSSRPASRSPLYGMWNVEELRVDGDLRPPLFTDPIRWRRMFYNTPGQLALQLMDDSREVYDLDLDERREALRLRKRTDPRWQTTLAYRRVPPDVLFVEGTFDGHEVEARLRRAEPPEFFLVTRGFRWINENPVNR